MADKFMFGIFNRISKRVKPLEDYTEYMFEHKKSSTIGSFKNKEMVEPLDLLRCDLIYPTRRDISQSNPMTVAVGIHAAIIFRKEFWDESKFTAKYCSTIRGAKSMKKVSSEQQRAGLVISTSNSVSESLHGA